MSYYQVPPQRSYTAGPLPSHSHSHSVPAVYPNSQYNPNQPQPTPQSFPYHQQPPTIARTPSPFRRALPSPQRSDPVPRSLTPGLTSPTAPTTASFSASASTFSVNSSGSVPGGYAGSPNVRSHSHSYSMGDAVQNGSPGSLPSPYPPNWSPGYQRQQQQPQYQQQQPQQQQQYWQSQPSYSQNPPYTPPHPQMAYTSIDGTPPQLPSVRTSSIFPPSQQFTGHPSYHPPQGMSMNGSPAQMSPMRPNGTPVNARTYSQPLISSPAPPLVSHSASSSSPTRRPLPTPGPQGNPHTNPNTVNSDVFGGRMYIRSPSPNKTTTTGLSTSGIPPRSQSPVKAIRDIFEARSGSGGNMQVATTGLHGKGWSEDSENGEGEARGRSGFAGPGGGRRASPPKFFDNDGGGQSSVKLLPSSTTKVNNPTAAAYAALPPVPLSSEQIDGTKFVPLWKRGKTFTFNNATPPNNTSNSNVNSTNNSNQSKPPDARSDSGMRSRALPQPGGAVLSRERSQSRSQEQSQWQNQPRPSKAVPTQPPQSSQQSKSPSQHEAQSRQQRQQQQQQQQSQVSRQQPQSQSGAGAFQSQAQVQPQTRSRPQSQPLPSQQQLDSRSSQSPKSQFPSISQQQQHQSQPSSRTKPENPARSSQPSQPLRYTQPLSQPLSDPRRTRALPPNRHLRSRSQGPPVAHQKPQDAPLLRGAPPGWRTTVNVPEFHLSESPPPVGPGHGRSRSMGPSVRAGGQGLSGSGSNSPTKYGRAPDGWRSTAFAAPPPPPDVNPRTGEVLPPKHKPPEGWRPTMNAPHPQSATSSSSFTTSAGSRGDPRQKREKEKPKKDSAMATMTNRAPEGWRSSLQSNVNVKGQQVVQSAAQQRGAGAPDGWRSMVPAAATSRRGGQTQMQQPQKGSLYRESNSVATPTRSRAPPTNVHGSKYGRSPVVEDDNVGDSSLEYDSGDAYSGIYDGEEGYSSSMNETAATGDEETDGASMMSRDTGDTGDSQDSVEDQYAYDDHRLGSRSRKQQPARSPQYGIRDLPKSHGGGGSNMGFNEEEYEEEEEEDARSMLPPSPGYGIRDLPVRTSFMGSSRSSHRDSGGSSGGVGALPRPPVMSRGGTSQGELGDVRSRPQSAVSNVSSQRSSRLSNNSNNGTNNTGEWPADLPPLPRAPSSTSSGGGRGGGRNSDSKKLVEQQARRRERDIFDLDDAPPVGVSALRRSPSPIPGRQIDDYEGGNYRSNTINRFTPQSPVSRPPLPPRQTSPSRPPTTHSSYSSEYSSSRPPSRPEQQSPRLPPRQTSPSRPLPQPSQRSRPTTVAQRSSQSGSDFQSSDRDVSTPASYSQPLPASRPYTPETATPQHKDMPLIEIQSPAPVSGWGRSDLPKIEIDNGGEGDHDHNRTAGGGGPSIMVSSPSAPTISINVVGDDDDDRAMGPVISVAGPEDDSHGADSNNPPPKQSFKRPLPPLHRGGGLICAGCGGAIVGRIVSAMGLRWHPQCFRCTVCDELLEHVSSFEHEGRPYCHLDYHENFAPRCYSCKTAIIEERFISLDDPALGKRTYHEQHFFCAECGDPFLAPSAANRRNSNKGGEMEVNLSGDGEFMLDDDVGFTVYRGHPYCEACHVRLRMPKCKKCKRSIRDGMQAVEALGGKWCYDCFVCAGCERPFEDPSFFQRGENPFCERCFSIILRNEI